MIERKEEINQFKRDLRSLKYYEKKIEFLYDELTVIGNELQGVKGIKYDVLRNNGNYNDNKIELLMREEEILKEMNLYREMIGRINSCLAKLSEDEQELLKMIYIDKVKYAEIAHKLCKSVRKMKLDVDGIIEKIIS